ncbi:histidine phosphatase family protein [Bacillus sp. KH172YL63]|uniref:histidine phosphatase family protein n=1 Tax=Bacillus sp. KH172YL63 TaxID=2709784 RepID=UPI0013E4F5A8|nr:histidine phosphatase family protein [Bacillus sp. KH172YL63]BCB02545.1 putative phosphatase PhoE [Bacillus sp. KH172YL63]
MTTIGFIRHGITEWNILGRAQGTSDIPLNKEGRRQASLMGERLLNEADWDVMIASDLSRAIETAGIIGNKINMPIHHYETRIREINCGEIEGTTEEARLMRWGSNWRNLDLGMERFEDVGERGKEVAEELVQLYNGKRILIVSHGALIGLTLKALLPAAFERTYIDNASMTILRQSEGGWKCELYNCTEHLTRNTSTSVIQQN